MEYQLFAAPKQQPIISGAQTPNRKSCLNIPNSKSLDPTDKPLTVAAWVKAQSRGASGVVIARGGPVNGYALYLDRGYPCFAIRSAQKLYTIKGERKIGREWTHITGVLRADGSAVLYLNGDPVASGKAALIAKTPIQSTQIGLDDESSVGNYQSPFGLKGAVDEVCIYHRALSQDEIRTLMSQPVSARKDDGDLVLCMTLDNARAQDLSPNGNNGTVENAKLVPGKFGKALAFEGTTNAAGGYMVQHGWTRKIPFFVRGMVLTGMGVEKRIFIAGPPDLVDETKAVHTLNDPATVKLLKEQELAWQGRKGALLWSIAAKDGSKLYELKLDSPPRWDGLVAAGRRLYMAAMDGTVRAFGSE